MSALPEEREWGAVFTQEEYQRRLKAVRQEMSRRGIDMLYITSPRNINYLTGYDSIWNWKGEPAGAAIRQDSDDVLRFDSGGHRRLIMEFAPVTEAIDLSIPTFSPEPMDAAINTVVNTLSDRGWLKGTVGIEKWSLSPSAVVIGQLEDGFSGKGAKVVNGSWTVDRVALVKSEPEIACVRKAAEIADIGMEAARKAIKPGVTEIEVQAEIHHAMSRAGGEDPSLRTMVTTGNTNGLGHKPPSRRKVRGGDRLFIDFCGVYNRYHSDLCRTFSVGESAGLKNLIHTLAGSLPAVLEAVKPGDPIPKVGETATSYIEAVGLKGKASWTGYDMGISIPPDWVGHTRLNPWGFEQADYVPGTITNYEIFSSTNGFIDTLLMTDNGLEVLSRLDPELIVV